MAAAWLLRLMDRYSLGYKVLPYLLAGLVDDASPARLACHARLDEIGALYEVEWADRVKADLDYSVGLGGVLLDGTSLFFKRVTTTEPEHSTLLQIAHA
ncbi:hypothetical protein BC830DRAFT_1150493 [Chytriomyces sp. MP71]|nr:hypothetical protein BC830DRAFT_1150493 [Chytriomyces sp. MP71]